MLSDLVTMCGVALMSTAPFSHDEKKFIATAKIAAKVMVENVFMM
jgi:hypothetical protein